MNDVLELTIKGTDKVVVYACGECCLTAYNQYAAIACCAPRICDECKQECPRPYTACDPCRAKKRKATEKKRFDKARKIPLAGYAGRVLYSGTAGEYLYEEDDYGDYAFEMNGTEEESYLWACNKTGLSLDAEAIIDSALSQDDHHEDAYEQVKDIKGLQALLDGWVGKQAVESYFPDYSLAVIMPAAELGDDDDE